MNLQKAALKMELAQAWGKRLQDVEDAAKRDLVRLDGMADAFKQSASALDSHRSYYQALVDADELTGDQCKFAMDVITRCVGGLQNLLDKATLLRQMKQGEVAGISRSIDVLGREYETERKRVEAIGDLVEHDARPDGAAADIQQRREEAKAAKLDDDQPIATGAQRQQRKKATRKKATRKRVKT